MKKQGPFSTEFSETTDSNVNFLVSLALVRRIFWLERECPDLPGLQAPAGGGAGGSAAMAF